jgi:hypothetical protein
MTKKVTVEYTHPGWKSIDEALPRGGVATFIGWDRLAIAMEATGTVRDDEYVQRFEVTSEGITIYIEKV